MPKLTFRIAFLLVLSSTLFAQEKDTINYSKKNHYFRINYDNDFFSATDRYYTQGILIDLVAPVIRYSPLSYTLIKLNKRAQNYYGLAFNQDCFTPRSIRYDTLNYTERPYAASMFVSHFLTSIDPEKKRRLTTKLDLGIIGPCARCEDEQKAIHTALVNIRPLGWEYQINSDYILNYSALLEQGFITKKYFEFIGIAEGRVGTLYDDASLGITVRAGFMNSYFKHLGVVKNANKNKFQCYVFGRTKAKFVAYNAMLQGGMINKANDYTIDPGKVERGVYMLYWGMVVAYKRLSLEYSKASITREFHNGITHGWGHCNISYCF